MNIVLTESLGIAPEKLTELSRSLLEQGHTFTSYDTFTTDETILTERVQDADIVMVANHPLPDSVIRSAPNLKMISVAFVGIDHIGTTACKEKEILISNTGGYCDDAVAELAVGLTLDCLRNITACHASVQSGGGKAGLQGRELAGKTVGIIGTGAIGQRTAEIFKVFGCKLIGYSRTQRPDAVELGIEYMSLKDVMTKADIISVHTPLTPDTKGLIGAEEIACMKPGSILINTARGPVIDTEALAKALCENRITAGIDVYEADPPLPADHPLLGAPNLVCTPHVGFDTIESIERRAEMAFENVARWMQGDPVRVMKI